MLLLRFLIIVLSLGLSLAPAAPVGAQELERRPVDEPLYGLSSVVPADWQDLGSGIYVRGTSPADPALIAIQSAAATIDQLWPRLLPQLALTDVPATTETYSSERLDWDLYRVDVPRGETTIAAELALAEDSGTSYVVLMHADPAEFEVLRQQVLLPALDALAPLAPEPTPDPSTFDYQIEEVTFPGGADDVTLAGTLTLPRGPGPHPVVVTMSGSGPQDRDESMRPLTALKPFAVLADALTSHGVGVLRYDDRGVGSSTGDYGSATIEDLAEDARAAIDYLETRADVDPSRIGLLGHSEGGLYAAMLGASDPRVAFIGMMAPAVIDGVDLIVQQDMDLVRSGGGTDEQVEAIGAYARQAMPLALEQDFDALEALTREFYGSIWDSLTEAEQVVSGDRETFAQRQVEALMPTYESDWYRSFLAYDPGPDWEQVTVPVLALFGGKDVQVDAATNEAALLADLEVAGNDDVTTMVLPDANHLFQEAGTGAMSEYMKLDPVFVDGFVDTVVDWFVERAGVEG